MIALSGGQGAWIWLCLRRPKSRFCAAVSRSSKHLPVNIGNPVEWTILECANAVLRVTALPSKIVFSFLPQDDPVQRKPNIKKRALLGCLPGIDLVTGLRPSLDCFRFQLDIQGCLSRL